MHKAVNFSQMIYRQTFFTKKNAKQYNFFFKRVCFVNYYTLIFISTSSLSVKDAISWSIFNSLPTILSFVNNSIKAYKDVFRRQYNISISFLFNYILRNLFSSIKRLAGWWIDKYSLPIKMPKNITFFFSNESLFLIITISYLFQFDLCM